MFTANLMIDGGLEFTDTHDGFDYTIRIKPQHVPDIRKALAIPAPTTLAPDRLRVVEIEEQLDRAQDDDVIWRWELYDRNHGYRIVMHDNSQWHSGSARGRNEGAEMALAEVERLRKPVPEPEEMDRTSRVNELIRLGWSVTTEMAALRWHKCGSSTCSDVEAGLTMCKSETLEQFECRVLREARELAAKTTR